MTDALAHAPQVPPNGACQRIAQTLIEENGWSLLTGDELSARVLRACPVLTTQEADHKTKRLLQHQYTIALYQACRQAQDAALRERAYRELHSLLYRAACNRWSELAEDAAQRALVLVYEQIDVCRDPGAFVAFALYKLRHALKQEQHARGKELTMGDGLLAQVRDDVAPPAAQVDQRERCRVLLDAIKRLSNERERAAIALKFLDGLSDAEIGAHLDITAAHVRVLRHRGLRRLRQDPHLRAYVNSS